MSAAADARSRRTPGSATPAWRDLTGRGLTTLAGSARIPSARDIRRFQRKLPMRAMMATGTLASKLREYTGRDIIDLESMQDALGAGFRASMLRAAHKRGEYDVDEFGFEDQWTEVLMPLARLWFRKYWRVGVEGIANVPRRGGALLVSNHAGVFPWDAAMIKVAVHDNVDDRHVRALVADWMFSTPGLSWFVRRAGQTLGHPEDTHRLLTRGDLVLVFPEGIAGTGKPFSERYRLRRFGRGGYVSSALRAGVPIVPISVVGSEETYPMFGDIKPLAKLLGMPYFPITPTFPWLGPLGLLPLPSKWTIRFHEPVTFDEAQPSPSRARVLEISDAVRTTISDGLIDMLRERRTVFGG